MRKYLLFLFLILPAAAAFPQQPLWQQITIDQGLPDPNITALAKSDDGRLFIGTAIGLFSYDGFSFMKVDLGEGGKLSPYINNLLISNNRLFIGARESVSCLDLPTGKPEILEKPMNALGGVRELYIDPSREQLFVLNNSGALIMDIRGGAFRISDSLSDSRMLKLRIVNKEEFHAFTLDHTIIRYANRKKTILFQDVQILDASWWEEEHAWLVVRTDGLFLLDDSFNNPVKIDFPAKLNQTENKWLYPDCNGGFWVQASGGLVYLPHAKVKNPEFFFHQADNRNSFTSNTAQAFFTEPDGTHWVGGDGSGLSYLNRTGGSIRLLTNEEAQSQHFWCFLHEHSAGLLWCGTTNGILRSRLGNGILSEKVLFHPPGFTRFSVNAIFDINADEYLISVYREGFWIMDKRSFKFRRLDEINKTIGTNFVFGIKPVSGNRLALLTQFNTWLLDRKTMKVSRLTEDFHNFSIFSFLEDSREQIIQAGGFGLQVVSSQRELLHYYARSNSAQTLTSDVIFDILEYRPGEYLLATMGGGLCLFTEKSGSFRKLPLPTNPLNIFGIQRLSKDEFILTTSGGLCRYNIRTASGSILNKSNALAFNDFNQNAFLLDSNFCFTGGEKGLLFITRSDLQNLFSSENKILVRNHGLLVSSLELPPGKHSMNLALSLKKIVPNSRLQFAYRIQDIDTIWQVLPYGQNMLVYSYLPNGNHRLEIRLLDETGLIHSGDAVIQLMVIPYFYQTNWFRGIALLLITGIIFLLVRYFALLRLRWKLNRLDAERKVMLDRARISRELHDNLGSQLTYLISGLETTGLFLSRNNLDKTAQNLEKMQFAARESMQQLRDSIWALKPENMTLQKLSAACEQWVSRITEPNEALYFVMYKSAVDDFTIDPLQGLNIFRIIQEAVHNVLKHASATLLEVRFESNNNLITILVSDNGKGIKSGIAEGNGLLYMRQRAVDLKASIQIHDRPEGGTSILLTLDKNTLKG